LFDTNLAIVGNVLTPPEWRRLAKSGSLVANFRVASTARRFDRDKSQWVDGNNLRVRVTAWRRLAEGVASSIAVGDPVVVYGRLYSRDWKDENGNNRVSYEMEAFSIGHDLARGRAKFFRTRMAQLTSELEASDTEAFIRGETSVPLTAEEAPIGYGDGLPDQLSEHEPTFVDVSPDPAPAAASAPSPGPDRKQEPEPESGQESEPEPEPGQESEPDSAPEEEKSPSETDDLTLEVERLVAEQPPASGRRGRRTAKREPVTV
jgi:single-strand DNA-binding protein